MFYRGQCPSDPVPRRHHERDQGAVEAGKLNGEWGPSGISRRIGGAISAVIRGHMSSRWADPLALRGKRVLKLSFGLGPIR